MTNTAKAQAVKPRRRNSAAEIRGGQITRQLERLRSRLAARTPSQYREEAAYRRQLKRARELISELEGELLMLDCPGEYAALPAAVVADEVGLSYEQARGLIKLGEIAATGGVAHERITRGELERVAALGPAELLRLGREESSEIFEQAVPRLQVGDLEAAERAYRRLEARLSWRGPYAPAFLVGLELAKGDLDGALSSVRLIYEYDDLLQKVTVMTYLGRVLRGMRLRESGARELCGRLTTLTEEVVAAGRGRSEIHQPKRRKARDPGSLQRQAAYLETSVMFELRDHKLLEKYLTLDATAQALEQEVGRIVLDALYTALYAEAFYEDSSSCRLHADMMRSVVAKNDRRPNLSASLSGEGERGRGQ